MIHMIITSVLVGAFLCRSAQSVRFDKYPKYGLDIQRNASDPEEQYVIRMGSSASMASTDDYFHYGKEMTSGWDLFTNWVNLERGGIRLWGRNYSVAFDYVEDYSNKTDVTKVYESMLSEYSIFHAPYSSSLTMRAADVTDPAGMLMIAAAASTTAVFAGRTATFATISSNNQYLESSMGAFHANGAKTVAVMKDIGYGGCGDTYQDSVDTATKYNLTLHGYYLLDSASSNYSAQVLEVALDLQAHNIETVVGCSYTKLCYDLIDSFKAIDYNPKAVSLANCIDTPEYIEAVGADARGFMMPTMWDKSLDIIDPLTGWTPTQFVDIFNRNYGFIPSYIAVNCFSSAEIILFAIEKSQSLDPLVLAETLRTSWFQTIYANVTFDENNQIEAPMIIVQQMNDDTYTMTYPQESTPGNTMYPMPTWKTKACEKETSDCSGHGQCNGNGKCVCDPGYYGKTNVESCDAVCDGILAEDVARGITFCKRNATFQIGGVVTAGISDAQELAAMMRLAVELINNKTDGFFDDIAPQVFFELTEDQWECTEEAGAAGIEQLDERVQNKTGASESVLASLIGPDCSLSSDGASGYADRHNIPQVSFASTLASFSDKNKYPYFARTCPSDEIQAYCLSQLIANLSLTNISVISVDDDSFSSSMASIFIDNYKKYVKNGHVLVHASYSIGSPPANESTYDEVMDRLAASGAPTIVMLTRSWESDKLFQAVLRDDVMSSSNYLWVGINDWIGYELLYVPLGSIGIINSQFDESQPVTSSFLELWKSLDPVQYPDFDGDRSTLASYSAFAVDAVVATAMAYQATIDLNFVGSESGRRQAAYEQLVSTVSFQGISGAIALDANGDRDRSSFLYVNNKGPETWDEFGSIEAVGESYDSLVVNTANIMWPNSNQGGAYVNDYANQYKPTCPAGSEPILKGSTYSCEACRVGYYKPDVGSEPCSACPEGADCNNVGIIVPCILPGYWRPQPPEGEEGDFGKWSVFRCDMTRRCEGGCQLNATCAANVKQTSPVCGVCEDGYYASGESCDLCPSSDSSWVAAERVFIAIIVVLVVGILIGLYALQIYSSLGINIFLTYKDEPEVSKVDRVEGDSEHSPRLLHSNDRLARSISYASVFVNMIRSHGLYVTLKLTLSFFQVLMGTIPRLNIEWSSSVSMFVTFVDLNPMNYFPILSGCNTNQNLKGPFVHILLVTFVPLGFIFALGTVRRIMQQVLRRNAPRILASNTLAIEKAMFDVTLKALVWFCLFSFPLLAAGTFGYFDCRDMGVIGSYMREDYSVRCDDNPTYSGFLVLAVLCVLLYPVGIPLFYYVLIRDREKEWAHVGSTPLHQNFLPEWAYFEVFELFRKLLLTSVVAFVMPGTVTQCNYLFTVNAAALLILTACRPYASDPDDFLSGVLMLTECVVFYLASLILSEVYVMDGYSNSALQAACFGLIVTAFIFFIPMNLALKLPATHRMLNTLSERVAELASKAGIKVTRLWKLDARSRYEQEVEALRETVALRNSETPLTTNIPVSAWDRDTISNKWNRYRSDAPDGDIDLVENPRHKVST